MKKAHAKQNPLLWVVLVVVMAALTVAVIFGCQAWYNALNGQYRQNNEVPFTVVSTQDVTADYADQLETYHVLSVAEGYDASGELVAYVLQTVNTGNQEGNDTTCLVTISADGTFLAGISDVEVAPVDENDHYFTERVQAASFTDQFVGRYLPILGPDESGTGSPVDVAAKATYSSNAVIADINDAADFVNNVLING